jgi:hypothetical protein
MLGIGRDKFAKRHVEESLALLNSLTWSTGDMVFLSEFVEFPNLEYPEMAEKAGIRALSPGEMNEQYRTIHKGIRRSDSVPKIAPYVSWLACMCVAHNAYGAYESRGAKTGTNK